MQEKHGDALCKQLIQRFDDPCTCAAELLTGSLCPSVEKQIDPDQASQSNVTNATVSFLSRCLAIWGSKGKYETLMCVSHVCPSIKSGKKANLFHSCLLILFIVCLLRQNRKNRARSARVKAQACKAFVNAVKLGLKIGQLLSQVSKPVRRLLHLFENVWFALLNDIV